jgi:hypothetical protein
LEGKSVTYGRQLIDETHTINQGYKFVYALLTHNAPTDEAEISLQKEIAEQSPDLAEYLLVIAKSRLSDNSDRFAERMKHLLLYRLFRVLTRRLRDETGTASELAIKQLDDLGVQSFERIILGTSRAEGAWSPDTLVRVIGVYQQQQIKQNIRKDSKLHDLVRDINPICDVGTSVMTEGVATAAKRLQHDEIYESGELINTVQLPLASGDVFEDTKGNQYVLLAQPCDLMVRGNGLRRSKDRDSRQMVPFAPLRKVESKYGEGLILPPEQYELPHFLDKERWSVRLAEAYFLPVWLLDLSVLNAQGRCSLIAGQEPSPLLIDPWRKRLAVLDERRAGIVASVNKITDESIDRAELLQSYCRIPMGSPFEVQLTQEQNGTDLKWSLTIGLRRTSRVTERHATAILIEYAAYLARLAHPHDLTRLDSV